jgi:hypothetical protein
MYRGRTSEDVLDMRIPLGMNINIEIPIIYTDILEYSSSSILEREWVIMID